MGRIFRVFEVFVFLFISSALAWLILPMPKTGWSFAECVLACILIMINAFYAGVKYVQDIYEIGEFVPALKYLLIVFYGYKIPRAKISGGKKQFSGTFDFIENIGGPAVFHVERDNVVVVETLQHYKDVLVAGERKLTRYDHVKDIFSTEEQYEHIETMEALTADGIKVLVKDIQIRFRIDGFYLPDARGRQTVAYLPSKLAVKDLAYQRPVPAGTPDPWMVSVRNTVKSVISEHINNSYLDDLISPRDQYENGHAFGRLREKLDSAPVKDRFKKMGARIDVCNVGEITLHSDAEEVDKQHLRMWFAKQSGVINVIHAQSEAESFASKERGRAEGQAMLLQGIARALQDIGVDGRDKAAVQRNLRNILLTRTAQILEARTSIYKNYDEEDKHDAK